MSDPGPDEIPPVAATPVSGKRDVARAKRAETAEVRRRRIARDKSLNKALPPGSQQRQTFDSFQNFLANIGIGTDNLSAAGHYGYNPITRNHVQLEWMYRGSWIAQVAVDLKADDMFRAGLQLGSQLPTDKSEQLLRSMRILGTWDAMRRITKWARLYGGAIGVLLIDGQNYETPLRIATIRKGQFRGIAVLDRWMVTPSLGDLITEPGDDMGLPKYYDVTVAIPGLGNQRVHHSRVIRILGIDLPYWQMIAENYWGLSVIEPLWDRLLAFDSTTQGAAQLVYKAYLRIWKVNGLRQILGENSVAQQALQTNAQMMRQMQTIEGISLVDGEDEFDTAQYSFSGLAEVLQQFAQQLSGSLQTPLVRLFGQSPSGFASGETDLRNYYDGVDHERETRLRKPIDKVLRVHAKSEGIELPQGFWWQFGPLWLMTEPEKATVASTITTAIATAKQDGIITDKAAAQELKQSSIYTGIFSNITEEYIEQLSDDPPAPMPEPELAAPYGELLPPPEAGEGEPPIDELQSADRLSQLDADRARHISVHGLPIYIETHRGDIRRGLRGWAARMPADYGYISFTGSSEGRGEGLDCFLGPEPHGPHAVFLIDQVDPVSGEFDEHKVMLGYPSMMAALRDYAGSFTDGSAPKRIGGVKSMPMNRFKEWLTTGDVTRRAAA